MKTEKDNKTIEKQQHKTNKTGNKTINNKQYTK